MTINPVLPNTSIDVTSKPKDLPSATRSFEALLISQVLKSVTESPFGGSWMGTGEEDQAGAQALSIAQEQFASALAAGGGLGLARMAMNSVNAAKQAEAAKP